MIKEYREAPFFGQTVHISMGKEPLDSSKYFTTLFQNSPDSIYLLDGEGSIVDVNPEACNALGYDREELLGTHISEFGSTDGEHPLTEAEHNLETDVLTINGRHTRKDGSSFPVQVRMVELKGDAEIRYLAISRDVSDLKAHQAELERKNEQLDEFASLISHDLRNLLNIAKGNLRLAREGADGDYLSTVADSLDRMEKLLDGVLTLAREGETIGDREIVHLDELVTDAATGIVDSGVEVEVDISASVFADKNRLAEVIDNLFRNAIEHGGDDVTIEVGCLDDGFYVEDDGAGFSTEDPADLFDSGATTKEDGTGFGLYVVQKIIEAHGWRVELQECESGGARIEIRDVDFVSGD